jgi:hypothetical protein
MTNTDQTRQQRNRKENKMFECRHSATGRLGYHATDYKTYKTIKQLNAWRIDAYRRRASWTRWFNKQPQNRRIEPHWTDRDRKMLRELEKIALGLFFGFDFQMSTFINADTSCDEQSHTQW